MSVMDPDLHREFVILTNDAAKIKPFLEIDILNIVRMATEHPASFAYLAQYAAAARGQLTKVRGIVDAVKGELFTKYKLDPMVSGGKVPSDETTKALVAQDPDMLKVRHELAVAEMNDTYWSNIMAAMGHRGFLVRELASQEMAQRMAPGNTPRLYADMMSKQVEELSRIQTQPADDEQTEQIPAYPISTDQVVAQSAMNVIRTLSPRPSRPAGKLFSTLQKQTNILGG